jgi:hypothetical protein
MRFTPLPNLTIFLFFFFERRLKWKIKSVQLFALSVKEKLIGSSFIGETAANSTIRFVAYSAFLSKTLYTTVRPFLSNKGQLTNDLLKKKLMFLVIFSIDRRSHG